MDSLPSTSCNLYQGWPHAYALLFPLIIPVLLLGCTSEAAGPDASAAIRPDFLVRNPEAADLNNNGFVFPGILRIFFEIDAQFPGRLR